jgi:hypothetical protein
LSPFLKNSACKCFRRKERKKRSRGEVGEECFVIEEKGNLEERKR